jgi:predicted enzyme related to lactoylglutathione lyase
MSNADIRGRFVWHELTTASPEGAAAFYGKLVTWQTQPSAMPSYSLWTAGKATVGGLVADADGNPQWLVYIGTEDVDQTVAHAKDLGATVVRAAEDIPGGVGRYAVLEDPQGARFAVFTPGEAAPPPATAGSPGEFSWHELATTDADEATDFYTELFGWERGPSHDLGSMGPYQLIELDGEQIGGIHRGRAGAAPRWLSYVRVIDADEAADIVRRAGGRVVNGPVEVPGGSWIVMLQDPQGAAFAVHEPAQPVQPVRPVKAPRKPAEAPQKAESPARKPARPEAPARAVAAEQPKPAVASELVEEPAFEEDVVVVEEDEDEETATEIDAELESEKPARSPRPRPRVPARKPPAKRGAAARRAPAKKPAVRAKAPARAKSPVRTAVKKKTARAKTPAKAPARAVARTRTPVRGRAAPPARRPAAKKTTARGRRR